MAKDSETVLEGFQEGPLKFPPTYKFDIGTNTYDTRLVSPGVPLLILGHWPDISVPSSVNFTLLSERSSHAWGRTKVLFFLLPHIEFLNQMVLWNFCLLLDASLSSNISVERSVNQLGRIEFFGAWEPLHLPVLLSTQGSVAPFQGWPVGPKWHSTATEVTWNTSSVTTNQSPPSLPCRWDTQVFIVKISLAYSLLLELASLKNFDSGANLVI